MLPWKAEPKLTRIRLYGRLRKHFGPEFRIEVSSIAMAVYALSRMVQGFQQELAKGQYRIVRGGSLKNGFHVDTSTLGFYLAGEDLHIMPCARGAAKGNAGNVAKIIIGVTLIALAVVVSSGAALPGLGPIGSSTGGAFGLGTLGGMSVVNIGLIGFSLVLAGVGAMLTHMPKPRPLNASFLLQGPTNTLAQGGPVNIPYGAYLRVGSVVISGGYQAIAMVPGSYESNSGTGGTGNYGSSPLGSMGDTLGSGLTGGGGPVARIDVINPGSLYTSIPAVTVTPSSGGSGCTATAVLGTANAFVAENQPGTSGTLYLTSLSGLWIGQPINCATEGAVGIAQSATGSIVVVAKASNYWVGQDVTATGIPAATHVTAVDTSTGSITLSASTTATLTLGETLTFGAGILSGGTTVSNIVAAPLLPSAGYIIMSHATTLALALGQPLDIGGVANAALVADPQGSPSSTVTLSAQSGAWVGATVTAATQGTVTTAQSGTGSIVAISGAEAYWNGQDVTGTYIPGGTHITGVDPTGGHVTLSANSTTAIPLGEVLTFGAGVIPSGTTVTTNFPAPVYPAAGYIVMSNATSMILKATQPLSIGTGQVAEVQVTTFGSSYAASPLITIDPPGGSGIQATALATVNL